MASWPASLPQIGLADGYIDGANPVTIRSTVDVGPAKLRPRYTAEVRRYAVPILLTSTDQVATLETFYTTTLSFGSVAFDWINQRTKAVVSLRFVTRPSYINVGKSQWRTTLELEELP